MKTVVIYDFMIKKLKLKGLELLFFALVYSFGQLDCDFYCSHKRVCEFLGCSRSQFFKIRSSLVSKGLIAIYDKNVILTDRDYVFSPYAQKLMEVVDEKMDELHRIAMTQWVDD